MAVQNYFTVAIYNKSHDEDAKNFGNLLILIQNENFTRVGFVSRLNLQQG